MSVAFHVTPRAELQSIREHGLQPRIGARSQRAGETRAAVYLFQGMPDVENALLNWLGEELADIELCVLEVDHPSIPCAPCAPEFELRVYETIPPGAITAVYSEDGTVLDLAVR